MRGPLLAQRAREKWGTLVRVRRYKSKSPPSFAKDAKEGWGVRFILDDESFFRARFWRDQAGQAVVAHQLTVVFAAVFDETVG